MDQWWNEYDDIDFMGGDASFIMNDEEDMIEILYHDGMLIDVGLDKDNIYNITVLGSNDKKGLDDPLCVVSFSERDMLHDKLQEIIQRFRENIDDNEETDSRTQELLGKYGMDFMNIPADEIRTLISEELNAPKKDSSEYLRLLCAYLFCSGEKDDAQLIRKVKFSGSMDILNAIDKDWISCLEGSDECERSRDELISDIMLYYLDYEDKIEWS